ncbi:hypothetical protein COOONC_21199 [Cooperia oncophora]
MVTLTTYSDLSNLEYLVSGSTYERDKQDLNQLKEVIRSLEVHIHTTLVDQMRAIILSEVEFVALLGLSLWSPIIVLETVVLHCITGLRDVRKMDNYAARLGDIMCLFVETQMIGTRIGEDVELLRLFNMYKVDSYVYDCLNGRM